MSIYDRINIIAGGKEKLTARPVEFEYQDGEAVYVTKFETTCSKCGHMIVFEDHDIVDRDGEQYVGCENCNSGFIEPDSIIHPIKSEGQIEIKVVGQKLKKQQTVVTDRGCPFIDPVDQGTFNPSIS